MPLLSLHSLLLVVCTPYACTILDNARGLAPPVGIPHFQAYYGTSYAWGDGPVDLPGLQLLNSSVGFAEHPLGVLTSKRPGIRLTAKVATLFRGLFNFSTFYQEKNSAHGVNFSHADYVSYWGLLLEHMWRTL